MEYITTKEASQKWGISTIRITVLANEGRIPGAQRLGKSWLIPVTATKPSPRRASRSNSAKKETNDFSFPLYHFRPDWNSTQEAKLSQQQKDLYMAETAVLECRFEEAYSILKNILATPDDTVTEIGGLWNAGICCIALNKPSVFSRIMLRLQLILSEDIPHRNDLQIILDALKSYVETIESFATSSPINLDIHDQCLPLASLQAGYKQLTKEAVNIGITDTTMMELNLRYIKTTSSVVALEMMHCYLLGIYYLRQDKEATQKHAKAITQLAYESNIYFPLVTYYQYFAPALSPVLAEYPEDFQELCHNIIAEYKQNYTAFLSTINEYAEISKLTDDDFPYIYAVLMDLPNPLIADKFGVSLQTVKRRINKICEKLGLNTKRELRDYLCKYM